MIFKIACTTLTVFSLIVVKRCQTKNKACLRVCKEGMETTTYPSYYKLLESHSERFDELIKRGHLYFAGISIALAGQILLIVSELVGI